MTPWERKKLEIELKTFTSKNFVAPSGCDNLEQIRFYIKELCLKIEEYQIKYGFVPGNAYSLLAQYNSRQNAMLNKEFSRTYSPI